MNRTTASAASGATKARNARKKPPATSVVAMRKLPSPPVANVELARSAALVPWIRPAAPPPAITAVVHLIKGGKSVMTAADAITPAITAAGAARASSTLSTPGM